MNKPPLVHVFDDADQLAHGAADAIVLAAHQAVMRHGRFQCALAGGSTPKSTYGILTEHPHRERVEWGRFDAWIGDERFVAATDPASNYRMIVEHLFKPARADVSLLRAYDTLCGSPEDAAEAYAQSLGKVLERNHDGVPVLDLVILGLGADAHTASWFPGSEFDAESWVAATPEPHAGHRRLTLTPGIVNAARRVLFLVSGREKQAAVERVFGTLRDPLALPAQRVAPVDGQLMWMLDRDAAGQSSCG